MLIVDSSVWVDFFAARETDETRALMRAMRMQDVAAGDLMLCEVLQGARSPREFERIKRELLALDILPMAGAHSAVAAAHNYRDLRRRGITVRGAVDCLIATFCIENGHVLLHNDRDFDPFEKHLGLRVLH